MNARLIPLLLSALLYAGCSKNDSHTHAPGELHNEPLEHGHGPAVELGTVKLADLMVKVTREGAIEAGKDVHVDLAFEKGKPVPGTVRGWIGVESGEGSMKAKFGKEGDLGMNTHVDVPKPLPAGAKLWIEAELASGPVRGSVDLGK